MILIGFLLVVVGAVVPWLIVLQILPSTYALNFVSFAASILGLMLGIAGVAYYTSQRRKR
jgi:hypothetical protein